MPESGPLVRFQTWIGPTLTGPPILAFLPAITLGAFWLGGERALVLTSLGLPLLFALAGAFGRHPAGRRAARDPVTGLYQRAGLEEQAALICASTEATELKSVCILLELDEYREAVDRHGLSAGDLLAQRAGERIVETLRQGDVVSRLSDSRFGICVKPVQQLDLEICIQLAGRIQSALEEPIAVDGASVYLSCTIGFCLLSRAPGRNATDWIGAAATALAEAQRNGASSIRAYSADIRRLSQSRHDLQEEAAAALENGQIQAWFQPQLSTDTGRVTGFEALARWAHPQHGVIPPAHFMPVMEAAGLMGRLGQVILVQALTALRAWDNAGMDVPSMAVNFTTAELRNPSLIDRIRWELDRFDLAPERLTVEILETVVAESPDDALTRTVRELGKLGCRVDLDDFGTGHASIAAIRRFDIRRIKIDRSFVAKADQDPEQQRMIAAILTMAEQLGVETLAEGVETVGEHALLAQLGCLHVQGFGIARPMPFEQTIDWITIHEAKLAHAPRIGRSAG